MPVPVPVATAVPSLGTDRTSGLLAPTPVPTPPPLSPPGAGRREEEVAAFKNRLLASCCTRFRRSLVLACALSPTTLL